MLPDSETMATPPLSDTYLSVDVSSDEEGDAMELAEDIEWGALTGGIESSEEAGEEAGEEGREEGGEEGREDGRVMDEGGNASQEVLEEAESECQVGHFW